MRHVGGGGTAEQRISEIMCAPERQVTLAYYVPEKISAQRKQVNMHIKKETKILTAMVHARNSN